MLTGVMHHPDCRIVPSRNTTRSLDIYISKKERSLIYQLLTVMYWITVALTDNGELGFDSGESA